MIANVKKYFNLKNLTSKYLKELRKIGNVFFAVLKEKMQILQSFM